MKKVFSIFAVLAVILSLFTFNASADISLPSDLPYDDYFVYQDTAGRCFLYCWEDLGCSVEYNPTYDTSSACIRISYVCKMVSCVRSTDGTWGNYNVVYDYEDDGSFNTRKNFITQLSRNCTFLTTTKDIIYWSSDPELNGTVFFKPPLPMYQVILEKSGEALNQEKQTLGGTMKILTVCGVGLIALLVALPLFLKVFHRLRVR